jgi:hypothetical protein
MSVLTFDFEATVRDSYEVQANGTYRLWFLGDKRDSIEARWASDAVGKGGVLTFSHDGDPGDPQPVIDMTQEKTAFGLTARVRFIDFEVTGFPAGGNIELHF